MESTQAMTAIVNTTIYKPCIKCNSFPAVAPEAEQWAGGWCLDCLEMQREHYTAALTEIYMLRSLLAFEIQTIKKYVQFKTFPKSARQMAAIQMARMRRAARGDVLPVYQAHNMRPALLATGASETLTNHEWERNRGKPD